MRVVPTERPLWRVWFCGGVVGRCERQPATAARAAEPAAVADRFAREISAILAGSRAARSRQLSGNPLGDLAPSHLTLLAYVITMYPHANQTSEVSYGHCRQESHHQNWQFTWGPHPQAAA